MKHHIKTAVACALLAIIVVWCCAFDRYPQGISIQGFNAASGRVWQCTNATTGEGMWSEYITNLSVNTINISNSWAFFITPEKYYKLLPGGEGPGEGLVFTNAAGVAVEWYNNEWRFQSTVKAAALTVTNGITARTIQATTSVQASNFIGSGFVQTNGFNWSSFWAWGGSNVQWRMVKNIVLTNVTDVSAAAYYPSNGTFFTCHNNNNGRITEWTFDGVFVRKLDWTASQVPDAESITYLGGNIFGEVDEDANRIFIFGITNNASGSTLDTNNTRIVQIPTSVAVDGSVSGVEGVCYDWDRGGWWIAHEKSPAQLLLITNDAAGVWYTNNFFTAAQMQAFTNANHTDFSDVYLDRENQILFVTQDEGGAGQFDRVLGISLVTSNVIISLDVTNFGQLEGVSLTPDGKLLLAGEVNQFAIFEPVLGGLNSGISWPLNANTNWPNAPLFPFGITTASNKVAGPSELSAVVITNSISYIPALLSGFGGALTNYVLDSSQGSRYINGFTNVSIRGIGNTLAGRVDLINVVITNISGTSRTLEFSDVTNRWKWSFAQGNAAPTTLTNGTALRLSLECNGTNIFGSFAYCSWP